MSNKHFKAIAACRTNVSKKTNVHCDHQFQPTKRQDLLQTELKLLHAWENTNIKG